MFLQISQLKGWKSCFGHLRDKVKYIFWRLKFPKEKNVAYSCRNNAIKIKHLKIADILVRSKPIRRSRLTFFCCISWLQHITVASTRRQKWQYFTKIKRAKLAKAIFTWPRSRNHITYERSTFWALEKTKIYLIPVIRTLKYKTYYITDQ